MANSRILSYAPLSSLGNGSLINGHRATLDTRENYLAQAPYCASILRNFLSTKLALLALLHLG